jgi:hypothetical protein
MEWKLKALVSVSSSSLEFSSCGIVCCMNDVHVAPSLGAFTVRKAIIACQLILVETCQISFVAPEHSRKLGSEVQLKGATGLG